MSAPSETSVKILIEFNQEEIPTTSNQVEEDSSENTSTLEENSTILLSESAQTGEIEELSPSVISTIVISESAQASEIEILPSIPPTINLTDPTNHSTNASEVEVVNSVISSESSSETPYLSTDSSDNSDKDTEHSTVIISSSEDNNHQPIRHQSPPAPIIETEEQNYQRYKRKRLIQWIECQQRIQRFKKRFKNVS